MAVAVFSLFKGDGARIPARLAEAGPPASQNCAVSTCGATMTWACAYADAAGATCHAPHCPDHLVVVDKVPFCRRHAGVASLLLTRVGTLLEMQVPDVEDRSLPLLLRVAAQLDERVVSLLQHLYAGRHDVEISAHADIRDYREQGRIGGWQALWSASGRVGHLTVISLRALRAEPPRLALARDGQVVAEGVPDWILRGDEDRWNGAGDGELVESLFGALIAAFATSAVS